MPLFHAYLKISRRTVIYMKAFFSKRDAKKKASTYSFMPIF